MEIPLFINGNLFEEHTIEAWQQVWDIVCKMSYENTNICEKIITTPGFLHINGKLNNDKTEITHSHEYSRSQPLNTYFLTLDNIWKQYSKFHGLKMVHVVPEFKELFVPRVLFDSLGVSNWFRYSFPNCKVTFWEEDQKN